MQGYVAGFLFSDDYREIVLVHKNRPDWQKGMFNGVGGKIEDTDLSAYYAMSREFLEEAGMDVTTWKKFGKIIVKDEAVVHLFVACGDVYRAETQTDEGIFVLPVADLPLSPIVSGLQWIIPAAILHNKNTSGLEEIVAYYKF